MEELVGLVIWLIILLVFGKTAKKKLNQKGGPLGGKSVSEISRNVQQQAMKAAQASKNAQSGRTATATRSRESSSMPHTHKASGTYDTYNRKSSKNDSGAMPHNHRESGTYDTFNRKSIFNTSGSMPHVHSEGHYTSMADASKLPPGYILLNGEPVRVADLEGK
ncbi:hypothetical protein [Butyrivibrio sp. WCD3002]|uniref:hypothetical protein n=1 Tax=Butyrivibrio sp. WCD3002 TaxID=1280676 RepID=UPI00041CA01F|nr:hypothetical protein [Butyrivibrio sp. WCD3002]